MAAAFAARQGGAATPDIRLYDAAAGDVLELYHRAVDDGAQLVIGPLNEDDLARLAAQPVLPVPVLGLNELAAGTGAAAANFHTLALAVADEAEAAAQRAWQDGRRAALVLVPDAPWGRRALDAFRDTFTRLGGEVRAGTLYDMALKDFVPVLRPLLAPAADTAAPAPAADAEPPHRRTDIDMVFLVAYPVQGRQINPSLDFLYAGDLPVYATSAIYAGVADVARDGDLLAVTTARGNLYRARTVVLAIGVRGNPRHLNLPGEEPGRVVYSLIEPGEFRDRRILVVGGGNAGAEVAQALAAPELGNQVGYSFRSAVLNNVTRENAEKISALVQGKSLTVFPSTILTAIKPGKVVLETVKNATGEGAVAPTAAAPLEIDNDIIFAMIGAELPTAFLKKIGIKLVSKGRMTPI
jgi:hypothetical protein